MIFGVDGTGPWNNTDYNDQMKQSFVNQLCEGGGKYWRGPDAIDSFTGGAPPPVDVALFILGRCGPDDKIYLTGYSRGGATVIDAARVLKSVNVAVEAMFLFDAVARSLTLSGTSIPSNVRNCYHAMRSPSSHSRDSFGNCGKNSEGGTNFDRADGFMTTHGGMGGVPWGTAGLIAPAPASPPSRINSAVSAIAELQFRTPGGYTADAAAIAVRDHPEFADKIYEGLPDRKFTAISVAQEVSGMTAVQVWMNQRLARHDGLFSLALPLSG